MGLLIAITILLLWATHLCYLLFYAGTPGIPDGLIHLAIQTYLYTGLFITAHDAMHGLVSPHKSLNKFVGRLSTWLFAALPYSRLLQKHSLHHKFPGEAGDPDFNVHSQNFWRWWSSFMLNYISLWQILLMAIVFNILLIKVDQLNLILYWILPSILSTFQLFYFGTYLPHRLPHTEEMEPHRARSQTGSHFFAMISCYFFGYHYEHHQYPATPWWKLYQVKNQNR